MPKTASIKAAVGRIVAAGSWNRRVALIREVPEEFGKAQHQPVYAAIAEAVYVPKLAPDFAYVHWRDEYELESVERAYEKAYALTKGFVDVDADSLTRVIEAQPAALRIFRLIIGLTTQEFAASTTLVAAQSESAHLSNGMVKSIESGKPTTSAFAKTAATVVDQIMRSALYRAPDGDLRGKLQKPDTAEGWDTVRRYARHGVPFATFLHQRLYGGAFRQLLDATSGKRGLLLENAVEKLFTLNGVHFLRTGPSTQKVVAARFGLTVKPAPDFVVHDASGSLRAILECKQANDGGTARDKAARFGALRSEAVRLGGVPLFAVLAGLGWRRTTDTLGPVIRDTDGRVFTLQTLDKMMGVDPFPNLISKR